jgi:hypothetical protein
VTLKGGPHDGRRIARPTTDLYLQEDAAGGQTYYRRDPKRKGVWRHLADPAKP